MLYISSEAKEKLIEIKEEDFVDFPPTTDEGVNNFLFRETYNIIKNKDNWCQGTFAKDIKGAHISPSDNEAIAWCSIGALERVQIKTKTIGFRPIKALQNIMGGSVAVRNDYLSHKKLMKLWEKAIAST